MKYHIIIPARYHSSRLPAKMLADIGGKPLLAHVYQRARQTSASSVVIATEDARICEAAKAWGAQTCLTSAHHPSGTDRVAEAVSLLDYPPEDIVVNVQGDQPFIPPQLIDQVARNLARDENAAVSTLCERIHDAERLHNSSVVKVVMDGQGYALYFSRSLIPWSANSAVNLLQQEYYQHIGLYAYRVDFIQQFVQWPVAPLEHMESLEQLRALWYGHKIHVDIALKSAPPEVNTAEDLERARIYFAENK